MTPEEFMDMLNKYGELHVTVDSGDEYHMHRHDVKRRGDNAVIDSRKGRWTFAIDSIESLKIPDSHKE